MDKRDETPSWLEEWKNKRESRLPEQSAWLKKQMRHPDRQLAREAQSAHDRAFSEIDCMQCANCCKTLPALITSADIQRISRHLKMTESAFVQKYTRTDDDGDRVINGAPCPFLESDNACSIYEHRPRSCRQYPHTGNNQFVDNLGLHAKNTLWCPAVFKILERLISVSKQ